MNTRLTILFVDDDRYVRAVLCAYLENCGFEVLSAADGPAALQIAQDFTGPIHVLVSDVMMPGMSGLELAAALSPLRPGMRILLISAFTEFPVTNEAWEFLAKPFAPADLAAKILAMCPLEALSPAAPTAAARREEEEILLARVRETHAEHLRHANEYDRLLALSSDAAALGADGPLAFRQAAALRQSTLSAYSAAVQQYSAFLKANRTDNGA